MMREKSSFVRACEIGKLGLGFVVIFIGACFLDPFFFFFDLLFFFFFWKNRDFRMNVIFFEREV